ncbi:hypothetical protein [Luteolibacter sp. Populi]|uniref:hypothetical protein n=1 Tax=Luteolibacter sp. Populi TaxID=3230487 RepID=UPI0034657AB7
MKFSLFLILIVALSSILRSAEISQEEMAAIRRDFAEWRAVAGRVSSNPTKEGILQLGEGLSKLELESTYPVDERFVVQEELRRVMLSVPNHGDVFAEALEKAIQSEFSHLRGESTAPGALAERAWLFATLQEIPSPQCVGLLGGLLEDDRDPWKDVPRTDVGKPTINSMRATRALNQLGIEGVPEISLKKRRDREAAREQWRLWFAQVKAGTRTFRFKGDPQEYNLKGPVNPVAPPPPQLKREQPFRRFL